MTITRAFLLMFTLTAGTACATQSSTQPGAAGTGTQAQAQAENVDDLDRNLKQFGGEVREFVASAKSPTSVEDPKSFRGRVRAGEQRLSERAGKLRERIHRAFGTQPVPTGAAPAREKQMLDELDQSEKSLAETRQQVAAE